MNWTYKYCPEVGQNFDWEAITAAYTWVQKLKNTPQDPIYHAEGDVYIHTRMVLEELIGLKEWQELGETERSILFLAALMHDIAKPICTVEEENGRISSPHHAVRGAKLARNLIFREKLGNIPFKIREQVVDLVRYHGLPLWIMEKQEPEKGVIKVSQTLNLRHLALLAEADVKGRICEDQEDMLERIEFFRELAKEQKCYETPFVFETDLAQFAYFSTQNSSPLYIPFDNLTFEVILLAGLPGSGKNTWITDNAHDLPQVCMDDIRRELKISPKANQGRVIQESQERAKILLRKKQSFIWNATNLTKQRRQKLVNLFTTYKARVKIVYIETPYSTLLQRNKSRQHPIPPRVLERFTHSLEVPKPDEAHQLIYYLSH